MSKALTLVDIPPLGDYLEQREDYRRNVLATKRHRLLRIGENITLLFENRETVLYQILEMMRIEHTADADGIQAELDAYNPLIPQGSEWKATMLIEFEDADERKVQLKYLRHVEHAVHAEIGGERIVALADEDMERSDEEKTSAVHFLRFALTPAAIAALKGGAPLAFGVDHPRYRFTTRVDDAAVRGALLGDLA